MANSFNLYLDQGTDFERTLTVYNSVTKTPVNLTNFTVAAKLKHSTIGANTTTTSFIATISTPIDGKIIISLTNAVTNTLISGRYSYDIEVTSTISGKIYRIVQGILTINPTVT